MGATTFKKRLKKMVPHKLMLNSGQEQVKEAKYAKYQHHQVQQRGQVGLHLPAVTTRRIIVSFKNLPEFSHEKTSYPRYSEQKVL